MERQNQRIHFMKNLSVIGRAIGRALVLVYLFVERAPVRRVAGALPPLTSSIWASRRSASSRLRRP